MDIDFQCGNDLRYILEWLHRFGHHDGGDPRAKDLIGGLEAITQALVQLLVSTQIANRELSQEFHAQAAKALTASAARFASVSQGAVHA
jgi:hypothetical protein